MAEIQDNILGIQINLIAQGIADLEIILTVPGGPVVPGTPVSVRAGVRNIGPGTDTVWCSLYANGGVFGSRLSYPLPNDGTLHYFEWTYTVNTTTTFSADCGHMVGSTPVLDHSHTTSPTWTTSILQYAHAAFNGAPTYPANVEPGEPFTITYPVKNDGNAPGILWGHLFDLTANAVVAGTEWATVAPIPIGGSVSPNPTANISITSNFDGELRIGHVE